MKIICQKEKKGWRNKKRKGQGGYDTQRKEICRVIGGRPSLEVEPISISYKKKEFHLPDALYSYLSIPCSRNEPDGKLANRNWKLVIRNWKLY